MRTKTSIAAAVALATVFVGVPALAQNVCLQLNRIKSTKVIDNKTIQAADWDGNQYTIHMRQSCVSLNQFAQFLTFRRAAEIGDEIGCIQRGDTVSYSLPGDPSEGARSITVHGAQTQLQCTIDSVSAGPPAKPGP